MSYFGFTLEEYAQYIIRANYVADERGQNIINDTALKRMAEFIINKPPEYRINLHPDTISGIYRKLIEILPDNRDKITQDFDQTLFNKLLLFGIIPEFPRNRPYRETLTPTVVEEQKELKN